MRCTRLPDDGTASVYLHAQKAAGLSRVKGYSENTGSCTLELGMTPVDTPSILSVHPWVTVAIQGQNGVSHRGLVPVLSGRRGTARRAGPGARLPVDTPSILFITPELQWHPFDTVY